MFEDQTRKKTRRGTTSCTDCRRRKVRCIRSPEDAQVCRRCEERGSECIAQTYSSQPVHAQRLPSRHRISQLESKVASLTKVVHDIELKHGYDPTQISKTSPAQPGSSSETDESDDNSSISDVLATAPPSHLHSLFQNDWLSMDTRRENEQLQDRKVKASAHLLDIARHALQKLIPLKSEVSDIARSASKWLTLLHTLLPQPFAVKSQQEMLESYHEMHKPDVDAISLASWLLSLAITAQQIPLEHPSPATQLKYHRRLSNFSREVSDTVEGTILSHDKLICTVQGLGMAMHFFRLQMSQGNFQKAWLRLRHFIAIAELMGLPKTFQAVQLNGASGPNNWIQLQRAQLWESISSADGLSGMVINLPSCIRPYQQTKALPLAIDGVIQPRAYLRRLTDITTKIQYQDDINTTQRSNAEHYAVALELDRQLRVLASQTPKSWWAVNAEHVESDHVVQFLHYCIIMRVHLSFAMRQDPEEEYIYSRLSCRDACESVAERYQFLRRKLPSGIFISQTLDLQAFTATVILLLTSHNSSSTNYSNLRINKSRVDSIVGQVIELMDEKSNYPAGSNFAQHGATTIRSLKKLLQRDDNASNSQELSLKIPLLGKLHVRRNSYTSRAPNFNNSVSFPIPSTSRLWKPNEHFTPQEQEHLPPSTESHGAFAPGTQEELQWDPLSWSFEENYEDFFQGALMVEEIDQFAVWENGYSDF